MGRQRFSFAKSNLLRAAFPLFQVTSNLFILQHSHHTFINDSRVPLQTVIQMLSQQEDASKKDESAEAFKKKAEEREREEIITLAHTLRKKVSKLWKGEGKERRDREIQEEERVEKRRVWEEMLRNEAEYLCDSPGGDDLLEAIA